MIVMHKSYERIIKGLFMACNDQAKCNAMAKQWPS